MARRLLALGLALFAGLMLSTLAPLPAGRLSPRPVVSLRILDRDGALLREVLSDAGGRCRWVTLDEVSPFLIKATVAAEDRFFYFHGGVDVLSTLRAAWQNLRHGRVVSGASTISQQVVRNIYPGRRTVWKKLVQTWLALRLERTLSKKAILAQYLNRISYGNQAAGIEAAARLYFDKPAAQLSLAEAAFLAAIPRSPSILNPYCAFPLVEKKQREIIGKLAGFGLVSRGEARRALDERLQLAPREDKFRAPHFCDYVLGLIPDEERSRLAAVVTPLDGPLQERVEVMLRRYLEAVRDRGITNGALVVLDNRTGEIRSLVGSRDYFDEEDGGQVNGALAPRQPGSALKPFTYALAFEKGLTAGTVIQDAPFQSAAGGGAFMPQNYDRKYHGPMSLRSALACSYNVPAVALLDAVGPDLLLRRLRALGLATLNRGPGHYGVGLTLGNGEVRLLELAGAYSALARGGWYRPVRPVLEWRRLSGEVIRPDAPPASPVFSPQVAYVITDILADKDARVPSFGYNTSLSLPFRAAAKTGTSKDFRDNWTLGFTPDWTVGIWVGNFNGRPMHNVSGITGAGPLFRDIMLLLNRGEGWTDFAEPDGISRVPVCPQSGMLPGEACPGAVEEVFIRGTEPAAYCRLHRPGISVLTASSPGTVPKARFAVSFPLEGDVFRLDPVLRPEHQRILLKAAVPEGESPERIEWWVNGRKAGEAAYPYSMFWNLRPGSFTIMAAAVRDGKRTESVPVRIVVLT
ncbi:MAG: penicillin-binding protein 1C [Candidatus Aminicenantes bacterium RBG_16_63_16]|nr:MAG: penicillin-binding protein 1C [Candidatus Aminicenantes bacterium RBG_16_63_16]